MRFINSAFAIFVVVSGLGLAAPHALGECASSGVSLQILGSAGPFGAGRASAGYIVWVDGKSRVMVDAGGGTFARFHESKAQVADLHLLGLSHFHPDHSAELPALLWPRGGNLRIAGPSGDDAFPSLDDYLSGLFGSKGVFRVLADRAQFDSVTVDVKASTPTSVLEADDIRVTAIGVPHGAVPALGFRVASGGKSIVFSSDQNGSDPRFVDFASEADILVIHFAGSENGTGQGATLHAKPSVWGKMATDAKVGHLVLSHISANQNFDESLEHLKANYDGPLTIGKDLMCIDPD